MYLPWMCGSPRHFNHLVMSFIALLFMQMAFFLFMPVETPAAWRSLNRGRTRSERFLLLVQSYDQSSNCFPSMHVSVATLAALHAEPVIGPWSFAFPALIAVSCVFTKQHYLIDLPAGAALGVVAFRFYRWLG